MCGRYTLACDAEELVESFDLPGLTFEHVPRYNVAPGQQAPVVAEDRRGRRIGLLTWGLVPAWRDEPGRSLVNARSESVERKPSFREAFERRRCLVPADGFYEWQRVEGGKVPFWIHPTRAGVIAFAGVWDRWVRPGAEPRYTFAILTTEANEDVRPIHDRMPVIIGRADRDRWLDRAGHLGEIRRLLRPPPPGTFSAREVSRRVNRTTEDDPGLVAPVDGGG